MTTDESTRAGNVVEPQQAIEEHDDCMRVVARVEACLDRHPDLDGAWLADLRREVGPMLDTLRCHFAEEQEGPLFRTIPVTKPRFADRLAKLEAEHASIVRTIEDVIRRGDSLAGGDPQLHDLREFNGRVQLLVATVRRHEAEENEIILQAYWDEIGVGD